MGKITLTFVLIMALNLNLISSMKETIEQKKFVAELQMIYQAL
jgi:hypothetical protein